MKHSSQFLYLHLYFHFQINIEFVNRNSALITTCDSRINSLLKKFSYEKLKCNEGISQIINGKYLCSKCPYFTHYENEECKLNDVIIIENEKLRFNLKPLKKYNQLLCNDQNGIFCYDNSFIVTTSNVINSIGNIITLIGVIFYCRKYRRILYEYEKIDSDIKSEIGSRIETKSEKKENKIEVVE